VGHSGLYSDLVGAPALAPVATAGIYFSVWLTCHLDHRPHR